MIDHNHIFQSRKGESRPDDCPACASIDPEHMTAGYAVVEAMWLAEIAEELRLSPPI